SQPLTGRAPEAGQHRASMAGRKTPLCAPVPLWPIVGRVAILLLLMALGSFAVSAEDWPECRGPTGQGHSSERGVPFEWSESRNVVWKTRVPGLGWSSPVVAGGRVWLTTATKERGGSLRVGGFEAETAPEGVNTEVFATRSSEPTNPKNSLASPTPIVERDRVYVHFGAEG